MKKVLDQIKHNYDFIFIDCGPSLGLLNVNALVAADSVLIPVTCHDHILAGLGNLVTTIKIVQNILNPELELQGMFFTMLKKSDLSVVQFLTEVRLHFGHLMYDTMIRHDEIENLEVNYSDLAKEILKKNKPLKP